MPKKSTIRVSSVGEIKLSSLVSDFQTRNRYKNLSKATLQNYEYTVSTFLDFIGEKITVAEINERLIIAYANSLREKGLRPASINHHLRGIRAFLYWCIDGGYVERFKITLMREQEPVKDTYSEEELCLLLREPKAAATYVEWRTWAVVNWILDNGDRAETVCSVRMKDISLDRLEVLLAHTKNKRAQMLPIGNDLAFALGKFIRKFRADAQDDDYLFASVANQKLM